MGEIYGKNNIFVASLPFLFVACSHCGSQEREMLYMHIGHAFPFEICVRRISLAYSKFKLVFRKHSSRLVVFRFRLRSNTIGK